MAELKRRVVMASGFRIHLVEAGKGPLVLMVHGFPGSWYSWRRQLHASLMRATARRRSMCAVTVARRRQRESTSTG